MNPNLPNIPSIPTPPVNSNQKEFRKNSIIVFFAGIQLIGFLFTFIKIFNGRSFTGLFSGIFIIPAIIIIFTKNERHYNLARGILIFEIILFLIFPVLLFLGLYHF